MNTQSDLGLPHFHVSVYRANSLCVAVIRGHVCSENGRPDITVDYDCHRYTCYAGGGKLPNLLFFKRKKIVRLGSKMYHISVKLAIGRREKKYLGVQKAPGAAKRL